jgi:hypothetical protein
MMLSAGPLTTFQRCPRQWLLNQRKDAQRRWRPKSLFLNILRKAVLKLSTGADWVEITKEAVTLFLEAAANPGLDMQGQPYVLARDFTSILQTVLARIHACSVPLLRPGPVITLSDRVAWACRAFQDESGMLHGWASVDSLNGNTLSRELHGWYIFGDCAAAGVPMVLHVIELGRQSGSHQNTPWCRAYRHPAIAQRVAFQKQDGTRLGANWKPAWYQDSSRNDPETWNALMDRDGVQAMKNVNVRQVSVEHAKQFREQVLIEAARMEALAGTDWKAEPMRRTSCDSPPCCWQDHCYQKG